ncbi:MAG: class I SAM-dependent methyltransferase [Planctomycetes bacterium]|nr:class I SAM-dependent methyltransferase [Planctomycetota bacterium]
MATREIERAREIQGDFADVRLPEIPQVPGMIKPSEARYLYWLASQAYLGHGAVVELGSFLGASAMHLAAGLRDGGLGGELHCFDRFLWDRDHAAKFDLGLAVGADYRALFEANVRKVYDGVRAHSVELREITWSRGPVELLFLDAPKKFTELEATLTTFAPYLEPGEAILAFQDFAHAPSYAVALVIAGLGERLELTHVVAGGSTAGFTLREPLPRDARTWRELDFSRWPRERVIERFETLAARIRPDDVRRKLAPGLPMALWDLGAKDEAVARMSALEFDDALQRHWERMAKGPLYARYEGLFLARGLARPTTGRDKNALTRFVRGLFGGKRRG